MSGTALISDLSLTIGLKVAAPATGIAVERLAVIFVLFWIFSAFLISGLWKPTQRDDAQDRDA